MSIPKVRVASRFLLPLEIFLGVNMLLWGLSALGLPVHGDFHSALKAVGRDLSVGISFSALGGAMALVAALEWAFGRPVLCVAPPLARAWAWLIDVRQGVADALSSLDGVYFTVSVRATLAFFAMAAWTGGAVLVYMAFVLEQVWVFYGICLVNIAFCWWVYIENLKVRYAINPKYATSTMEFHR
jgi:hypothetical protein